MQLTPQPTIRHTAKGRAVRPAASLSGSLSFRLVGLASLCAVAACDAPPAAQTTSGDTAAVLACSSDAVEFTLRDITPNDLTIEFADSQFRMNFVESTSANMSSGPVSLTTYLTTDVPEPFRLTLARDGTSVRARLQYVEGADLSAMCNPIEGDQ